MRFLSWDWDERSKNYEQNMVESSGHPRNQDGVPDGGSDDWHVGSLDGSQLDGSGIRVGAGGRTESSDIGSRSAGG